MTNKDIILGFYQAVFNDRKCASEFVTADFVEDYSAELKETGVKAFYERYAGFFAVEGATAEVIKIAGEGDKVAAYIKMRGTDGVTFIRSADVFHLRDGKIAWHTATIQPCQ